MTVFAVPRAVLFAAGLAVTALSGCATVQDTLLPRDAQHQAGGQDHVQSAIKFLEAGEAKKARAPLKQALRQEPANKNALSLLAQIEKDPQQLLGPANFPYTVKPGETLPGLAARFLDDKLKFYALGRYNDMKSPADIRPGQILRIPGEAPRAPQIVKAAAVISPQDAMRARVLRGEALVSLNRGAADSAVPKLESALALDPDNKVIQRDLERARRLQKATPQ